MKVWIQHYNGLPSCGEREASVWGLGPLDHSRSPSRNLRSCPIKNLDQSGGGSIQSRNYGSASSRQRSLTCRCCPIMFWQSCYCEGRTSRVDCVEFPVLSAMRFVGHQMTFFQLPHARENGEPQDFVEWLWSLFQHYEVRRLR